MCTMLLSIYVIILLDFYKENGLLIRNLLILTLSNNYFSKRQIINIVIGF